MKPSRSLLLAAPLALFDLGIFATAIVYVVVTSVTGGDHLLQNYVEIVRDPLFQDVLWRTLWVSAVAAVISLVLGFVVACHMWMTDGRTRAYLTLIVISPLLISVVVRTFGWIVLLGASGPLTQALEILGVPGFRLLYTVPGVITALVHVHLPYAVLGILASLDGIDPLLLRASRGLGARPMEVFTTVILPLAVPGLLAGGLLAFVLNLGSFVTPVLIGGPRQLTLGGYVHQEVMVFFREGTGYAASVIMLIVAAGLTAVVSRLGRRRAWQTSAGA